MLYLICPERSKWFLSDVDGIDELVGDNPLFEHIREAGKASIIVPLFEDGEESGHVFYTPSVLPEQELSSLGKMIADDDYLNRPMTGRQAVMLADVLTSGDIDDEDAEDDDGNI